MNNLSIDVIRKSKKEYVTKKNIYEVTESVTRGIFRVTESVTFSVGFMRWFYACVILAKPFPNNHSRLKRQCNLEWFGSIKNATFTRDVHANAKRDKHSRIG